VTVKIVKLSRVPRARLKVLLVLGSHPCCFILFYMKLKYGDTLTGGGEGVIKSEGRSSMLCKII
jgi:hypothetical protein